MLEVCDHQGGGTSYSSMDNMWMNEQDDVLFKKSKQKVKQSRSKKWEERFRRGQRE